MSEDQRTQPPKPACHLQQPSAAHRKRPERTEPSGRRCSANRSRHRPRPMAVDRVFQSLSVCRAAGDRDIAKQRSSNGVHKCACAHVRVAPLCAPRAAERERVRGPLLYDPLSISLMTGKPSIRYWAVAACGPGDRSRRGPHTRPRTIRPTTLTVVPLCKTFQPTLSLHKYIISPSPSHHYYSSCTSLTSVTPHGNEHRCTDTASRPAGADRHPRRARKSTQLHPTTAGVLAYPHPVQRHPARHAC
jgi:hypothetical protein